MGWEGGSTSRLVMNPDGIGLEFGSGHGTVDFALARWNWISRYLVDGRDGTTQHHELRRPRVDFFHRYEEMDLLEW